jgi:hypothetical protein
MAVLTLAVQKARVAGMDSGRQETAIDPCIREAAGGLGWLERTLWGLCDQEAGWIGSEVHNSHGSHDLGLLQINSFWVPGLALLTGRPARDIGFWLINDPCFNVQGA